MSDNKANASQYLILSPNPERQKLREVRQAINTLRDRIAELDLENETLCESLHDFESNVQARLAPQNEQLRNIDGVVRSIERWFNLLTDCPAEHIINRFHRIRKRRRQKTKLSPANSTAKEISETESASVETSNSREANEQIKSAYRQLARRYHPDLACTEEERITFGQIMSRINTLYKQRNVRKLEAWAEQSIGADIEMEETDDITQIQHLCERQTWFQTVYDNLLEERRELERSPTCELLRNVEQGQCCDRDLVAEIQLELKEKVGKQYADLAFLTQNLEEAVQKYNRRTTTFMSKRNGEKTTALLRQFDPYTDKKLVRLSLQTLATYKVNPAAERLAEWIDEEITERPQLVTLLLLGYVSELCPFQPDGLQSYKDLALRYNYLHRHNDTVPSLEETLVAASDFIEYGVRAINQNIAVAGLRLLHEQLREAIAVALRSLKVRRVFAHVLKVLGKANDCPHCKEMVFELPLYRTRGLDNLRATVCPRCGHVFGRYWMPKGKDLQAILNAAYIDFDIISEISIRLARSSFGLQLIPDEYERYSVNDLKRRIREELFQRYDLDLKLKDFELQQNRKKVSERKLLVRIDEKVFRIRLKSNVSIAEIELLEMLRFRIRNKFKKD